MFFVFGKKLWEIMENFFSSRFRLVFRLIWPPYQAYLASVSGLFGLRIRLIWRRIRLIRIAIRLSRGAVRLP